jgi:DNA-binding CsgD family transcriptional regulator/tetratricopeptide (TPR) repeat protein
VPLPDPSAVAGAVEAELERGDATAAFALLQPAAHAMASESGAGFRELVDRLPYEIWHSDPVIAAALGQSYRAPGAPRGSAGLAYFAAAEAAVAAAPTTPAHCRAAVLIGHAGALRGAGRLGQARTKLAEAEELVAAGLAGPLPAVMEVRARCALERGLLDLHTGAAEVARESLLTAGGLAPHHLGRAERAECAGALALLDIAIGDIADARRHLEEGREIVAGSGIARSGFAAPGHAAELLLALDRFDLDRADALETELVEAAANTEWEPYAALIAGSLRAVRGRPTEALDLLADAQRGFRRRDMTGVGRDCAAVVQASQLSALGRGDEAWSILARVPTYEHHVLCPGYHLAAQLLAGGDVHGADAALAECEAIGDAHAERGLMHVRILRGAIAAELGDAATSRLNVDLAFIGMSRSGSRTPLRAVPPARLAGLVASALEREQSVEVQALLEEARRATDGAEQTVQSLSRRERLVLAQAGRGATVAAIAAALFISPNTVKTHLRRVYRKLGVTTRDEAIRRARTLGLHEITRDSPIRRSDDGRVPRG